jgi:probable phosphoglycerate mutase
MAVLLSRAERPGGSIVASLAQGAWATAGNQHTAIILSLFYNTEFFNRPGHEPAYPYIVLDMKDIYVVTHTESFHHTEGKVGGWYDTGLTEQGKAQARKTARRLKSLIDTERSAITSSDLLRAIETAEVIGAAFDCQPTTTADLREISYGKAEGRPEEWLADRILPAPDDNRLDHMSIEQGETKREFIGRIYRAVDEIIRTDTPTHIIVTHGFALTFVVARWIGMPEESAGFVNFHASTGGITHLQEDDFWRNRCVMLLNDTSHLIE